MENKLKEEIEKILCKGEKVCYVPDSHEKVLEINQLYTLFSDVCAKLLDWYETTPLYTIKELNEDSSWSDITNYFIQHIYKQ